MEGRRGRYMKLSLLARMFSGLSTGTSSWQHLATPHSG